MSEADSQEAAVIFPGLSDGLLVAVLHFMNSLEKVATILTQVRLLIPTVSWLVRQARAFIPSLEIKPRLRY